MKHSVQKYTLTEYFDRGSSLLNIFTCEFNFVIALGIIFWPERNRREGAENNTISSRHFIILCGNI